MAKSTFSSMGYFSRSIKSGDLERWCAAISAWKNDPLKDDLLNPVRKAGIAARNEMVEANLSLVASTIKKYPPPGKYDYQEVTQEGCIGLIEAAENYDISRGFKFSTYATHAIMQHINTFSKEKGLISVKHNAYSKGFSFIHVLCCGMCFEDLFIESDHGEWDGLSTAARILDRIVNELKVREQEVIRHTFGIGVAREDAVTLGRRYNISRERVRQIKCAAIKRLQQRIEESSDLKKQFQEALFSA